MSDANPAHQATERQFTAVVADAQRPMHLILELCDSKASKRSG